MSVLSFILAVSIIWNHFLRRNIIATLEAKESQNFLQVGTSILSATCDAVVQLSSTLQISHPSPQFDALLLRNGPPLCTKAQGANFTALIQSSEEIDKFERFLERSDSPLGSICINLKDSMQNNIGVRILHAAGLDVDDHVFHLLGINEIDSANNRMQKSEEELSQVALSEDIGDLPMLSDLQEPMSNTSTDQHSVTSDTSLLSDRGKIAFVDCIEVWFDPLSRDYKMHKCTRDFKRLVGRFHRDQSLLKHLPHRKVKEFQQWVQSSMNNYAHEEEIGVRQLTFRVLDGKGSRNVKFEVRAVIETVAEDENIASVLFRLVLSTKLSDDLRLIRL